MFLVSALRTALLGVGGTLGLFAVEAGKKATLAAGVLVVWFLALQLIPGLEIEVQPEWIIPIETYIFPTLIALSKLPVIGTMMEILYWVATFEVLFFLFKLVMKIGTWTGITGDSIYRN